MDADARLDLETLRIACEMARDGDVKPPLIYTPDGVYVLESDGTYTFTTGDEDDV